MTLLKPASCAAALAVLLAGCAKAEPARHLIPREFVGNVYVVFGVSDGLPPSYDGRTRIYRIPTDGILRTQFRPNPGWSWSGEIQYVSVDPSGNGDGIELTQVWRSTIHDTPENRADTAVGIYSPSTGAIGAKIPGTNTWSTDAPCSVQFEQYFVGRKVDVLLSSADPVPLHEHLRRTPVPCKEGS